MKKYLVEVLLTIWSFSMLKAQSPNADSDLVWKYYPEGNITQMKLSPNNSLVVYGIDRDTMFYFVDSQSGLLKSSKRVLNGRDGSCFSFNNYLLAIGGNYYDYNKATPLKVDILDYKTGEYLYSLEDSTLVTTKYSFFRNVCFSSDGKYLLANAEMLTISGQTPKTTLFLWDLSTKKVIRKRDILGGEAGGVIDPSSKYVTVSYGDNYDIGLLNFQDLSLIKTLPQYFVGGFDFSDDGKYLATCGADGHIKIWDISNGFTLYKDLLYTRDYDLRHIKFTPDSKYIVSGGGDCKLSMWDFKTSKIIKEFNNSSGYWGIEIDKLQNFIYSDYIINSSVAVCKLKLGAFSTVKSESIGFEIYPNPSKQFFTIPVNNISSAEIKVFNSVGQIIFSNIYPSIIDNKIVVNCGNWQAGIYNISLVNNNKFINYKLIKE